MNISLTFIQESINVFPEIYIILSSIILLMYGVFVSTSHIKKYPLIANNIVSLSVGVLIISTILMLQGNHTDIILFNNLLIHDRFSYFVKMIVIVASIVTLLISVDYIKKEQINSFEYGILVLIATSAMLLLTSSYDLLSLYLAIELQSLTLYVLAAYKRESLLSTEAGLKYFILGAFSSGILLFGCSLIYGFAGTTNFEDIQKLFIISETTNAMSIGILFVAVGLLFKIYAVPFHVWVPDVYQGAPTIVTAYFALAPSIAVVGVFVRLFHNSFGVLIAEWQMILILTSIASMVIAAFAALAQRRIKRLIAYSAIGHVGYLLIGFSAGTPDGVRSMLLYSVIYIIMTAGMFTFILSARELYSRRKIVFIHDLNILFKTNPLFATSAAILLFSLAGIPPLAGFFSKLYIFLAGIQVALVFVVIVGVVMSVIGTVYYLRLIQIMYFDETKQHISYEQIDWIKSIILGISVMCITLFFVYPSPLMVLAHHAALTLCI